MAPLDALLGWDEDVTAEAYAAFTRAFPMYSATSRDLARRADLTDSRLVVDLCGGAGATAEAILAERDRKLDEARQRRAQRRQEARAACYNGDARPEDKALLASNLSAVPGPEAREGDCVSPSPSTTLLLA